jgi:hypothetical protein
MGLNVGAVTFTGARWISVGITLIVILGSVLLAAASGPKRRAGSTKKDPGALAILTGEDGRVSTSRTVALAWTVVVVYILFALIIANPKSWGDALGNLSPTYLLLLGFPYASLVLAKATVSTRVANGTLAKNEPEEGPSLAQLFNDDSGNPDVFDVQYVAFNVVAMVFVLVAFARAGLATGFPSIPTGILTLTGGPAAVYLSNKLMPGDAPAIFSVSPAQIRVGQGFTVIGQNLAGSAPGSSPPVVTVGGLRVADGGTVSPTSLTVTAPDVGADLGRPVAVAVTNATGLQAVVSAALTVLGRVPALDGASTGVAQVGDPVALTGDWTADEANSLTVVVDADVIASPTSRARGTVRFEIPQLANLDSPRNVPVQVKLGTELSNTITMLVSAGGLGGSPNGKAAGAATSGKTVLT